MKISLSLPAIFPMFWIVLVLVAQYQAGVTCFHSSIKLVRKVLEAIVGNQLFESLETKRQIQTGLRFIVPRMPGVGDLRENADQPFSRLVGIFDLQKHKTGIVQMVISACN